LNFLLIDNVGISALFGTPIAGELVKSGYGALSYFSGTTMLAGAALIAASRFNQNQRFLLVSENDKYRINAYHLSCFKHENAGVKMEEG